MAAADFSDLAFFEARGITYKDGGQIEDGLQILKNHGINCVRLRLWTSSAAEAQSNPYNYTNNNTYTIPLAVRVKNAGLLFSLDFHYSDTWADPGAQAIPTAWTNLNFTQLVQEMRTYNSNTIAAFAAAGAMPDFVQIGNEITAGLLFNYGGPLSGSGGTLWSQCGQLLNAAVMGIQDAVGAAGAKMPKIIVHIDSGANWTTTEWFFDNLAAEGVPYDIIGLSYYPFYQGSLINLNICLTNAALMFGKPIVVAEDAFPYTNTCPSAWLGDLYGYPPTPAGQVSFVAAVGQIIRNVPNQLGYGFFYWGTEYQAANGVNEAGFNTASFFDQNGNLLPVANTVGGMGAPFVLTQPTNLTILTGGNAVFSAAVIGSTPLVYQWQQNGTNLAAGTGISGADTTNLMFTGITTNSTANYTLIVTNVYGSVTSSVAALIVVLPPTILWSFTNLTLAADANCSAPMPDVTGTNFILATDLSGTLAISQSPTNDFILPLGTNIIVITVADVIGNTAFSTNAIVVEDQTPPLILSQPQNQTNLVGATANFSVGAIACTLLAYQWFFNNTVLNNQTKSALTLASVNTTNAGNYSVTATASGGSTTSVVASLTVFNPAPVITGVTPNPDGSFVLNLAGAPGSTYILETTANLISPVNWQSVATNTLGASGVWQFTDTQAVNVQQQFYRLELAP